MPGRIAPPGGGLASVPLRLARPGQPRPISLAKPLSQSPGRCRSRRAVHRAFRPLDECRFSLHRDQRWKVKQLFRRGNI